MLSEARQSLIEPRQALSTYWRRNISSVEAVELANLLGALRKITGHLGLNIGTVTYAGLAGNSDAAIVIDPADVMGSYPVPAALVDQMAGVVIHEALHQMAWSEHMWRCLKQDDLCMADLPRLHRLVETAEDIYVDATIGGTLGLYLAACRETAMQSSRPCSRGMSVDGLLMRWWAMTWGIQRYGGDQEDVPAKVLYELTGLAENLKQMARGKEGVARRCEIRAGLYRITWERIAPLFTGLTLINRCLAWYPEGENLATPAAKSSHKGAVKLGPELIRAIELNLAAVSTDLTAMIAEVAGSDAVVPTSRWDFNIPAHPVIDCRLVGRLRLLFLGYSEREKVISRGLTAGRIDARRLFCAPSTGRCFKSTESRPAMDWNVTLLADASGSMRGAKWRVVENTVAAIHNSLIGHRNHFQAYGYFEQDGVLMFSSLVNGEKLMSLPPSGQTASGQAIIAAVLAMPIDKRRRLLIHITDGESNLGLPVQDGIDFCRRRHIHLVTLGCGCMDRQIMLDQYGDAIEFIDDFRGLPQAVERLLRRLFLRPRVTGWDRR
jgi:hypothetical protein